MWLEEYSYIWIDDNRPAEAANGLIVISIDQQFKIINPYTFLGLEDETKKVFLRLRTSTI